MPVPVQAAGAAAWWRRWGAAEGVDLGFFEIKR